MVHLRDIQGSLKTQTITMQTPQETLLGTPETLATSEPGAGSEQITYTVASGDLPTFGVSPDSQIWVVYIIGAGKAVTAATISWRMKKNGASVATGSSAVAANTYYTRHFYFYNAAIGDVFAISLWSNQNDSNWDYKAYQVQPTRVLPKSAAPILAPCNFSAPVAYPTLTLGNPSVSQTLSPFYYHEDQLYFSYSIAQNFAVLRPTATYGLFRIYRGDLNASNNSSVTTDAAKRPYYDKNAIPTIISFRAVKI